MNNEILESKDILISNIPIETLVKDSLYEAKFELEKSSLENKSEQQRNAYKQALIDIELYVLNNSIIPRFKKSLAIENGLIFKGDINYILQIIDKVLGDDDSEKRERL